MLNGILEIVKSFQQPTKPENVPRRKTATQQGGGGDGAQERGSAAPVSPGIAHRAQTPRQRLATHAANVRKRTQTHVKAPRRAVSARGR